ncbi:hypothetical protein SASPL_137780 [Salvia splendens]|uniref:Ubiquitin-like protease family profile domain-containing protein n=1 Tax=Salvia splendens TaxID=180675 RepID=A0A8X8WSB3_SALSN|nr:hypothetical protein SASPL_137780 [Salvia splendens]
MDATREELSDTMAVFRLSGMEIRDLIMELSDNGSAKKNFISQIDNEIQRTPDFNWRKIDVVFFPVCANFHYYLVVYWMKKNTIEIIDNHKPHKNMDPFEKYDIDIGLMSEPQARTKKECGVYLIRHIETYVGKKGSEWDIGFSARGVKIPHILRGRKRWNRSALTTNRSISSLTYTGRCPSGTPPDEERFRSDSDLSSHYCDESPILDNLLMSFLGRRWRKRLPLAN